MKVRLLITENLVNPLSRSETNMTDLLCIDGMEAGMEAGATAGAEDMAAEVDMEAEVTLL